MYATSAKPQRKQLSQQIDRFEALLDGLSEGLDEAIADAARAGTRLAVKDAIVEILTGPELRTKLQQTLAQRASAPLAKPNFWTRLKARVRAAGRIASAAAASIATHVMETAAETSTRIVRSVMTPVRAVRSLGNLRRLLWVGAMAGLGVGAVAYLAPQAVTAGLCGASSAVAAMSVCVALGAKRPLTATAKSC